MTREHRKTAYSRRSEREPLTTPRNARPHENFSTAAGFMAQEAATGDTWGTAFGVTAN